MELKLLNVHLTSILDINLHLYDALHAILLLVDLCVFFFFLHLKKKLVVEKNKTAEPERKPKESEL